MLNRVQQYFVKNEHLDIGLCLLLFPEPIELRQSGLDLRQ
jgi:hypothetical protein